MFVLAKHYWVKYINSTQKHETEFIKRFLSPFYPQLLHKYFATTLLRITYKDKVLSYVITKYYICVNVDENQKYFLILTSGFD